MLLAPIRRAVPLTISVFYHQMKMNEMKISENAAGSSRRDRGGMLSRVFKGREFFCVKFLSSSGLLIILIARVAPDRSIRKRKRSLPSSVFSKFSARVRSLSLSLSLSSFLSFFLSWQKTRGA